MILVTGAAGKTGRAVIAALAERQAEVRAWVHRREQVGEIEELGARQVVVGDLADQACYGRAFKGIRGVYHIAPNMHPGELEIGRAMLRGAKAASLGNFVFHSVLHPQTQEMPHHWQKLLVEEQVFATGLPFTILQPAVYMQNIGGQWNSIQSEGRLEVPYSVASRLSLVDLQDVAEVAAMVLTEEGHVGATYELVGTRALTQRELAAVLSSELGREVAAVEIKKSVWEAEARRTGLASYKIDCLLEMFSYYERNGLIGSPKVLGSLLNRSPAEFDDFVGRKKRVSS